MHVQYIYIYAYAVYIYIYMCVCVCVCVLVFVRTHISRQKRFKRNGLKPFCKSVPRLVCTMGGLCGKKHSEAPNQKKTNHQELLAATAVLLLPTKQPPSCQTQ